MVLKRGDNFGTGNGVQGIVNSVLEMECFEKLGPRSRAVISTAPIKILAAPVVFDIEKAAKEKNMPVDFRDPRIDASIAAGLRQKTFELLKEARGEQDALLGITELRPNPGARRRTGRRSYR